MQEIFKEFGLSDKEIKVYLSLLKLGQTTTQKIAEITGINRVTLYDILRYLSEKGFVGSSITNNVKCFYPTRPKILLNRLKEREIKFSSILPKLESMIGDINKKPVIQVFEGKKGIDIVNDDVLKENKEIIAYGSFEVINKIIKYQAMDFMKKRMIKKIKWRGISDSSFKENVFFKKRRYKKLTKLKIDNSLKDIKTWNYIYNNKIAILSFNKENFIGIIIEDAELNKTQKLIFEKIWKQAKSVK